MENETMNLADNVGYISNFLEDYPVATFILAINGEVLVVSKFEPIDIYENGDGSVVINDSFTIKSNSKYSRFGNTMEIINGSITYMIIRGEHEVN